MQHHEDVDLVLVKVPAAREQKPAVVIFDQDQQQIPNQRKVHLALNVDLPKIIRLSSSKPPDRFNRRQAGSLQVVLNQYPPYALLMDWQLKKIPNQPGTAVTPLKLGLNNAPLLGLDYLAVITVAMVVQTLRTLLFKPSQISADRPSVNSTRCGCLLRC
jgi:hypothetical protein